MTVRPDPFIGATRVPWLRTLAQALRLFAIGVGAVAATGVGWLPRDAVMLVVLVGFLLWRWLPFQDSSPRLRDVVALEVVLTTAGVLLTGGWGSPWLLSQLVPVGLAALGLTAQRTAAMVLGLGVVTTLASIPTWPGLDEVLLRAAMLALVGGFGAMTRAVLASVPNDQDPALGRLDDLWSVRALLQGLHTTVADSGARFDIAEAVATVRSGSDILQRADVLALLQLQPDGTLRTLHAAGLPDAQLRMRDLPQRVGQPRRDGAPFTLDLAGGGLGRHARQGAYLWLPVEPHEDEHVLVVEFDEQQTSIDDVLPELARIAKPLAVTVSNAAWFSRVKHLGVDEERQRIAARLHDQFAQSLTVVSMRLEAATRRYPDDPEVAELRAYVKETLSGLRDTMVELRAAVDEEQALPAVLEGLVERLGDRHGVIAEVTVVDEGPRPARGIEQQLLRITQELAHRAIEDRNAIAVYVTYTVTEELVELRVSDDGEAPDPGRQRPVTEVVRDRAEAVGGQLLTEASAAGLGTVVVRIARQPAPRRVEV